MSLLGALIDSTGAGIVAASGLPIYRGVGGMGNKVSVDNHATAAAVQRPDLFSSTARCVTRAAKGWTWEASS